MSRNTGLSRNCDIRHQLLAFAAVFLLIALLGCRGEPTDQLQGQSEGESTTSSVATTKEIDTEYPVVHLETNLGTIAVRLNAVQAPLTVRNFLNYVGDGFYSDTLVHYVAEGRMIIAGGYTADGTLKRVGPAIRNEAHNGLKNRRGTIAMARDVAAGIDTATSQFFINLADAPTFDHRGTTSEEYGYCVFGEVVEGMDVADRIAEKPTRDRGGDLVQMPDPPVVVESVQVVY